MFDYSAKIEKYISPRIGESLSVSSYAESLAGESGTKNIMIGNHVGIGFCYIFKEFSAPKDIFISIQEISLISVSGCFIPLYSRNKLSSKIMKSNMKSSYSSE